MKLLFSIDKRPTLICILCLVLENAERILRILLPAFVLESLTRLSNDVWIKTLTAIACISVFGYVARAGRGLLTPYSFRSSNLVQAKLREKLMKLSLEHSESKKLFDQYELVDSTFYKFMDTDYYVIYDFFGAVITFLVMSLILCRVNLIIYIIVLILSVIIYQIRKKEAFRLHEYETEKKQLYAERKIYLDMLYDTEKIKEMKLFRAGRMISDGYEKVTELLANKDIDRETYSFRMNVKREITALFQVIAIYLNAAGEYKLGQIGTGMVYIMVSAGAEIVGSVIDIVHAANQIREVILYYDDFNQYMQEKESMYENAENAVPIGTIERIEFKNVSFRYQTMEEYSLKNVSNFSDGECQKIAIARVLYEGTQTLILDEPTSAMDAKDLVYEGNEIQHRNSAIHFQKEEKKLRYEYLRHELQNRISGR